MSLDRKTFHCPILSYESGIYNYKGSYYSSSSISLSLYLFFAEIFGELITII